MAIDQINQISGGKQLEELAKLLTTNDVLKILGTFQDWSLADHWKWEPLLIGMPSEIFCETLMQADNELLKSWQKVAHFGSMQYQLNLLMQNLENETQKVENEIETLSRVIGNIDPAQLSYSDHNSFTNRITSLEKKIEPIIIQSDKALLLAWHTNRPDIVEKLSQIKEHAIRILNEAIGKPVSGSNGSTGLYALLTAALFKSYGDNGILKDEEPAYEALSKLGLWNMEDYQKIGFFKDKKIDMPLSSQHFVNEVAQELSKYKLNTFKDLKDKGIFSKQCLSEYLTNQE